MSQWGLPSRTHDAAVPRLDRATSLRVGWAGGWTGAGIAALAATLASCAGLRVTAPLGWVVPFGLCVGMWLIVGQLARRHLPTGRFGPANTVTLIRAAMMLALIGPLITGEATGRAVAMVAAVALTLDGVDGWFARRTGMASAFGARFDIEVDAALALVLALHAFIGTAAGAEVLALGLVRYVFVVATVLWPWLAAPLPQRWRRKAICVVQLAALILLQWPDLHDGAAIIAARLALALVVWSFAVDILWLRERRA
ncbi:CDP-alcohol phosphatidyltransferase family protein [Paracoccus sp. TK19116]|uniref:CDP-alcohol phosphatidyltransferase family protein n=1 Tax=Paracoccus albicereus TaxID=2922394 RepID=A0ABT1MWY5_9RHOB|nr:CDP-alcohol phosphatidyltransferase family protein [Paracoccus albicereus]MCQ0972021.1 CDP-alcohol phosphatidyltransferase family protein [Paracoccus albicereus]